MKLAIIETGGKQYLIKPGDKISVEKLNIKDEKLDFDKVLLLSSETGTEIGKPYLLGKKIPAEILEHKRLSKITVLRYHSKTRYRKKKGHRQHISVVKISNFLPAGRQANA
ncbi:MAG: 50S ribosomal protein L21 [Patescibacteria group bacterium]